MSAFLPAVDEPAPDVTDTVTGAVQDGTNDAIAKAVPIGVTVMVALLAWRLVKRFSRG